MKNNIGKILFNGKKNVLWGAGKNGIDLLFSLIEKDIYVAYFCDTDTEKQSLRIYNKLVISTRQLLDNRDEYNIIVTPAEKHGRDDMLNILTKEGIDEYILGEDIGTIFSDFVVNKEYLYNIIRDSYTHRIIVCGTDNKANRIVKMLKALDVKIEYIIDDTDQEYKLEGTDIEVKPLYRVLDETKGDFVVIVPSVCDREKRGWMETVGFRVRMEYNFFDDYRMMIPRCSILDPNLGYSFYGNDNKIPGFVWFGKENGFKIVTLGGSTTDAVRFPFKSWSQILSEKLEGEGNKVCVICGGCIGYKTSQELVKLIRDVIPLKPDMILDYSGYNDALFNESESDHLFLHHYQIELFTEMHLHNEYEEYGEHYLKEKSGLTFGLKNDLTRWQQYINNIKVMKGVCDIFGIKFFSFLQPWLATKPIFSMSEREMIINYPTIFMDRHYHSLLEFYKNKNTIDSSYMIDLTQIFNSAGDVYIDRAHVNEKGNEIIANNIMEIVKEKLGK